MAHLCPKLCGPFRNRRQPSRVSGRPMPIAFVSLQVAHVAHVDAFCECINEDIDLCGLTTSKQQGWRAFANLALV